VDATIVGQTYHGSLPWLTIVNHFCTMVFAMTKVLAVAAPKMVWYKLFNCNFHVGSFHHFLVEWAGKT